MTEFIEHRAELVKTSEIKKSTLTRNSIFIQNIRAFLIENGYEPVTLDGITPKMANEFYLWIQTSRGAGKAYASKNMQMLKAVINHAILCGHIKFNVLSSLRFKRGQKKKVIYLSPEQVMQLESKKFSSERIQQVADLFILQCHTGFSYSDLANFDPTDHIEIDSSGRQWIVKPRTKNESECVLPLFDGAAAIIRKYTTYGIGGKKTLTLPVVSNQKYNSYLKEIGDILGFNITLTTHVGRKTFGTVALNNGYSIEAVSKMLGHTSIKTTQDHYAVVLKKRIIGDRT